MNLTEEVIKAWEGVEKPVEFVADIESKSQAVWEYEDVENYFSGLHWHQVDPEHESIAYGCPLYWMNEAAAKYYTLSFLVYLASQKALETDSNAPDMFAHYLTGELSILNKLSKHQKQLALKIVAAYENE